jgi:hypothetical protein
MEVCLASTRAVAWILFTFDSQEFIHPWSMSGECEYSSSRNRGPSDGPQIIKWKFSLISNFYCSPELLGHFDLFPVFKRRNILATIAQSV